MTSRPLVVKFGGELLEDPAHLASVVAAVTVIALGDVHQADTRERAGVSVSGVGVGTHALVIVHGGGKEIDAALNVAGIEKKQIDGLRITDHATLNIAIAVLAGSINTRLVAALGGVGVPAVGLTGADAKIGLADPAPPRRSVDGRMIDLGRVGVPAADADMRLLDTLTAGGFVPVIACIGVGRDGRLLNVNADTLAGHLAARLGARRLVVAGATPGVLDRSGATLTTLDAGAIADLVNDGTASAGMIAKLRACEHALNNGVDDVVIVDGRKADALTAAAIHGSSPVATRIRSTARV